MSVPLGLTPNQSMNLPTPLSLGSPIPNAGSSAADIGSEFESVFFSLLIKNMRTSMTEEGLFGSETSDTLGGLFDLFMGQHLAKSSSLGIASILNSYYSEKTQDDSTQQATDPVGRAAD